MSPDQDPPSQADLDRRRVPLERKVSLKFKEFRGFITEVSHNVSLGGMFIGTTSPKPPGTIFDFELSLTDDFKLVQGIGEVVWIREGDGGPGRPPGMGVRFLDLSPESRRLVQRIVEEHVGGGGVLFELEAAPFPPPPLRTTQQSPAPTVALPVFHPTAAPMASPPPGPGRPPRAAGPAPSQLSGAPEGAPDVSPDSPTAHLPRAPWPRTPVRRDPPEQLDLPSALPDLEPPELPVPDLASLGEGVAGGPGDLLPSLDDSWASRVPHAAEALPGPASRVPEGFAEVARAFGSGSGSGSGSELPATGRTPLESDDTVRLEGLAAPGAVVATAPPAASRWDRFAPPVEPESQVVESPLSEDVPLASPRAPRPPRARSHWPVAAVLLLLLGAAAAAGVLYLRFPQLLPAWAPGAPAARAQSDAPPRFAHPRQASPAELAARSAPGAAAPAGGTSAPPGSASGSPPAPLAAPGVAPGPQAAAPAPVVGPAAGSGRFSALEEIWGQRNAAGTMVTLVADGNVPQGSFTHARLDGGKPREVVYLRGVAEKFERATVAVGTPEVAQVRTGYHVKPGGNELHVVVDLASPQVKLIRAVAIDNRIELLFGR